MPISAECQECGTRYNVPDKLAGKRAKCKKCGATMSIPEPRAEVGFAPEEDPLAALQDLARASGEAEAPPPLVAPAPRRRPAAAIPADWTPESVIVEKESSTRGASAVGSGRWANTGARPVDPDALAKLLVFFFLAALIGVGVMIHRKLTGVAPTRGVVAWWTWVVSFAVLFFALAAPLAMIGPVVAAKLFRRALPDGAYLRAAAVATLPLTLLGVVSIGVIAGAVSNSVIWTVLALVVPLTVGLTWYLFEVGAVAAVVGWVLGVVPYVIGLLLAASIAKPITNAVQGDAEAGGSGQVAAGGPFGSFLPSVNSGGARSEMPVTVARDSNPGAAKERPAAPTGPSAETERKRTESAANLRAIHRAITAHYTRANRTWPVDLASLERDGSLAGQQLVSPFGPAFASGDYVYKSYAPETPAGPDVVVAFDNAEFSNGDGANVLFGAGQVRWLDRAAVEAALAQTETLRVAAVQAHEQRLAARRQAEMARSEQSTLAGPGAGQGSVGTTAEPRRGAGRADVAERVKAGSRGLAGDVVDVAMRRGTEQLVRPITPASAVAVLVRDARAETIEVLDGKSAEPVEVAEFAPDPQFRNNPGAYALSPDGKLVARLTSFPKLRAVVYSFEKKAEALAIDLEEKFGEPTIVGFLSPDKFVVRWSSRGEHGFEVWDAKTGKRGRQVPLFRVDPQPSPGSEAVSHDGRTYAIVSRAAPANAPRGRAPEPGLNVLLYDVLAGPTQPRRFPVPVLNNQPGVSAAGLAFSGDKQRLSLLLLDTQGRAVVVTWNVATGKPLPEKVLSEKIDPPRVGFGRARMLDWVGGGRALLVGGRLVLNPDSGEILAVLDAGKVHGQAVTSDTTVHLAYGEAGQVEGLVVVPLNEARLPEKAGAPNRAVAAPAR